MATIAKFVQNAREITTWLEGYLINYGIMAQLQKFRANSGVTFCHTMLCINAAYTVVRSLSGFRVSVTFVCCVKTAKDTAIVAMECE